MKPLYRTFFGFTRDPFGSDLHPDQILKTQEVTAVSDRFDYLLGLGAIGLVTGEVGSGKSTALRWAVSRLHPSEYRPVWITASSGSILELYRNLCFALEVDTATFSRATLLKVIRRQIIELARAKKQKLVLILDEASLLRLEVFAELHTLTQFDGDSNPLLPMVLAGQNNLVDLLLYRTSIPLSSRIVARCHLKAVSRADMELYLHHHLQIAGVSHPLFSEQAITAIHQGSGGLLRRANHLARGSLIAAANEKIQLVSAEHVRVAATELL
jgi:type II secretory pathway predicted ATPase ExeA